MKNERLPGRHEFLGQSLLRSDARFEGSNLRAGAALGYLAGGEDRLSQANHAVVNPRGLNLRGASP